MSSRSIALYQAHTGRSPAPSLTPRCFGSRTARTTPPPPMADHAADVRAQASELRAAAFRIMARADELEESADRMSADEREAIESREALESGCLDDTDPRHPHHPLWCPKPCCRRSEP